MKRKLRLALGGIGLLAISAVPIALVACGSTDVELTEQDRQYLASTNATAFGSAKLTAPLIDLVSGKNITTKEKNKDGSDRVAKNYILFVGTTACPVCNTLLTGKPNRQYYNVQQDINSYSGSFPTAVNKLRSDKILDETFVWEDLAYGYGDADAYNGNNANFP